MAYRVAPQSPYGQSYAPAVPAPVLLGRVLGITALGLCVTAGAAWLFGNVAYGVGLIAMIVGFILLLAINATRQNEALSLALFYAFTFCEGVGIAPVISNYNRAFGSDVVVNAALTTGLGMFALGAVVYATGLDLRRFQGIFVLALLGLIVAGVVSAFVHFLHPATYAWLTLVIFSGLVLIDFARIRAGGDGLTAVQMATSIYLDAINIFLALLQIFGGRRSSD
ncbi:MAG: US12 family protein [Candidatus Eremiobacteraeota bacterium]|nr:US12 family protein [Candidatus Eremiobacteraeota bacterium]MBV8331327.1 US12 family protein [Candidatus Eremiobacteraeota bacterium]MBV8433221.1 US12 family protein [Candidatus Eremiobacteraeota bacterium]MBV8721128.1 US12 family protein [Candidatus Eremiobacteraeota bacterium]